MNPKTGIVFLLVCGACWYILTNFEHIFGYSHTVDQFNQVILYPMEYYAHYYKYTIIYLLLWVHAYQTKHRLLALGLVLFPFVDAAMATYVSTYPGDHFAFLRVRHFR